jgi:hypothetical protein
MATHGSPMFDSYTKNLRRIYWAEFIDVQTQMRRAAVALALAPNNDTPDMESLSPTFEYYRHRSTSGA